MTHLKRLELQGFKSFPEKVRLEFNPGITAVVGPNGSGKSNISDSVRWVLGEQRAKSLRGDKMEDVIFAGTQNRKPLGFAEVSIILDNKEHSLPIEYTEVKITRRVYRSGESEYQINGSACRLKDIHELFMDTGIGREGYSIIEQGKIDEILSGKSDDRRKLFEEAAGIVKYKNRRLDALDKLEKEEQNLVRVQDIIVTLEEQMEPLAQEAEVAKRYLSLQEQLKFARVQLFCLKMEGLDQEQQHIQNAENIVTEELQSKSQLQESNRKALAVGKESMSQLDEEVQKSNEELSQLRAELEKIAGEKRLKLEQKENLLSNQSKLSKEIEGIQQKHVLAEQQISICQSKMTALQIQQKTKEDRLMQEEQNYQELISSLSQREANMETYKSDMIEKMKRVTELKTSIERQESALRQYYERMTLIQEEKKLLESQIRDGEVHIAAVNKKIEEGSAQVEALHEKISQQEADAARLLEKAKQQEQKYGEVFKSLQYKQSRWNALNDMKKEHDGYFKSVKSILQLSETKQERWKGICGAVGELLHVDKQYEIAIETALGAAVQHIVTNTEEEAKASIQYLKDNHLGRATFLPLSAMKEVTYHAEQKQLLEEPGILGTASDLIQYDKKYQPVISQLLGKVFIADTIDNGLNAAKKFGRRHRIVTLEGDVFSPGGAMTGGSQGKKTGNLFGRSRELRELEEAIQTENKYAEELHREQEVTKKIIEEQKQQKIDWQNDIHQWELQLATNQKDREQSLQQLGERQKKQGSFHLEELDLTEQTKTITLENVDSKEKLGTIEDEIAALNQQLSQFKDTVELGKQDREEALRSITEYKIAVSTLIQEQKSAKQELSRLEQEMEGWNQDVKVMQQEISQFQTQALDKQQEWDKLQELEKEQYQQQQEKESHFAALNKQKLEIMQKQEQNEETLQTLADQLSHLKNEAFRLQTGKEKLEEDRKHICDTMWNDYEITYSMAKKCQEAGGTQSSYQKQTLQLGQDIKALGMVNVNAIGQYQESKEKLLFLTGQRDDIVKAEEQLQTLIQDLTARMEEQFSQQFERISENFNLVFQEMFGGGKAYLALADKKNALESGIDIIAQPPGKMLQSMMLLSGGERALTAIAILFAILKMKPSPFCILDEIEAALDDANVRRYANYLKNFANQTQFIVITHRKGSMEAADVMYGVTMQEQGVSKLVSVKFEDAKENQLLLAGK